MGYTVDFLFAIEVPYLIEVPHLWMPDFALIVPKKSASLKHIQLPARQNHNTSTPFNVFVPSPTYRENIVFIKWVHNMIKTLAQKYS